jgi:crotonobetainyl-CoA:carnitine CoA-transferase CaiB-like acyl-CoA transferase
VLVPGNPVKMTKVAQGPESYPPTIGEHTASVLRSDLGLSDAEIEKLRAQGVVN